MSTPTIDPFDTPMDGNSFTEMALGEEGRVVQCRTPQHPTPTPGPLGAAIDATRSKLFEEERRRAKALEVELRTLRAEHENLRIDRDQLQVLLDGYGENEPPIVKGALDAQADAEKAKWAAQRRAEQAERELVNVRQALAHATEKVVALAAELAVKDKALGALQQKVEQFEKIAGDLRTVSGARSSEHGE